MTAYKDSSFWHFFSAVESFLYGETNFDGNDEGTVWGIHGFAQLWQDMCNDYIFRFYNQQDVKAILYADSNAHSNQRIGGQQVYVNPKWGTAPFYFELTGEKPSKKRYLRPDLVIARRTIDDDVEKDIGETFNPHVTRSHIGKLINISLHLTLPERKGTFQTFIKKLNKHASRKQLTKGTRVTFEGYHESDYQEELKAYRTWRRIKLLNVLESGNQRNIGITIVDYKYISHLHLEKSLLNQIKTTS